jgi:hypothetical protein
MHETKLFPPGYMAFCRNLPYEAGKLALKHFQDKGEVPEYVFGNMCGHVKVASPYFRKHGFALASWCAEKAGGCGAPGLNSVNT